MKYYLDIAFKVSVVVLAVVLLGLAIVEFVNWCAAPSIFPDGRTVMSLEPDAHDPAIGDSVYYKGHWWKVVRRAQNKNWNNHRMVELVLDDNHTEDKTDEGKP